MKKTVKIGVGLLVFFTLPSILFFSFIYLKYNEPLPTAKYDDSTQQMADTIKSFIKHLKIPYKARDYQISSVLFGARKCRGLLVCPTASGKSLIIYGLTRWCHEKNLKTLILVPTTSLVEQMAADFIDYGWLEAYIQKIYSGHEKKVTKDVVISTWQSIYKFPKKYFEQFGCVIGDEAHLFKAKSLTSIMSKLHLCKYRFGLTGTLDDLQTHKLVLEGLFGTVNKVISTKELIEKKTLAKFVSV